MCRFSQESCESIVRERRINCFVGVAFKPVVYVDEGLFPARGFFVGGDEFASGGAGFVVLVIMESKPRMSGLVHLAVGPLMAESEDIKFLPIVSYEPRAARSAYNQAASRFRKIPLDILFDQLWGDFVGSPSSSLYTGFPMADA